MGKIIVQKFGGTSVQNHSARDLALDHVQAAVDQGYQVVMVVSAMGRKGDPYATDSLLNLVSENHQTQLTAQELDQLMATGELISMSVMVNQARQRKMKVAGLTGAQAGVITNYDYQSALVDHVDPKAILTAFQTVDVVIVAGFQGVTTDGHVTTLGRGGSDTSATAIGAALNACFVDIFTDVNGVMNRDPKQDPSAQVIPFLTYTEMVRMAENGAKVVHPRAVKIAMNAEIPFRVRSTYRVTEQGCTIIGSSRLIK
ncbi:putative aspartate kinase I [Limosilactobacillus coleohominis 101-4-CHN]|uniref:aspartate kinase n=1 Tax=Limosilactobacillus coleohominis 101-4-CHN TaxID=575594 RepID=C7XTT4_9LACO|nr:aspartate kinase, monofunctional class [Limosilactobacillus coleohominis]EEU30695.1 putative aspartate kinase I [Limosilactobacillus coleohominis 101-4-CHN]